MEEKSNIDILKDFAKNTNREIFYKESPYPKTGIGTIQKFRREVYIPLNQDKSSFLVWFSDAYGNIGSSKVFCGVFRVLPFHTNSSLSIRPKNIIDKINIFSGGKNLKTGNDTFDSKVIIEGDMDSETKRFLSRAKLQKQIISAFDIDSIIMVAINQFHLDFIPELKGKSCIGIVNPQSWYLENKELDKLEKQTIPIVSQSEL